MASSGGAGSITNTASVGLGGILDLNTSNNTASVSTLVSEKADLSTTKLCKPDTTIYAGSPINCTVFVDNHAPSYARDVVITDTTLSSDAFTITNVAVSPGPTSCNSTSVTGGKAISCSVGTLANASTTNSGRVTLTYTINADEGQDINNVASVNSSTPDPNVTNNQTAVNLTMTSLADLSLTTLTAPPAPPGHSTAGTPATWTLNAQQQWTVHGPQRRRHRRRARRRDDHVGQHAGSVLQRRRAR